MSTYTPHRVVILCRISDARDEDTTGVDDQEKHCRGLADRLGWKVWKVVVENDVSAYKRRKIQLPDGTYGLRTVRPGLRDAIAWLSTGEADALIAYDLDRAVRDPRDLEDLIDAVELRKPRPPVESVTGSLRLANDADITMARVMVAVANKASRDTARRVANARLRKATNGEYSGGIRPFGFLKDGVTVEPAEAAEIVKATEALLAGASLRSVVRSINAAGVKTSRGKEWNTVELRDMLRRARNAGLAVYKGEVVGQASWPAIVPEESWRAVVALLNDPARRTSPGNRARWLGSGLYICGGCGETVICSRSGPATRPYYRCRPPRGGAQRPGNHVTRTAELLDEHVEELIIERLSRPDAADLSLQDQGEDVAPLHVEAVTLRARLDELATLHADGEIDARQLSTGSIRLRNQLKDIENRITAASQGNVFAGVVGTEDTRATWKRQDLGRKRAILDALMTVTIMPARHGRGPDGSYFDPASVRIEPKR
ncbi:recombinase family protein [Streptosporangium pseudovulgare]|uniref:Site-specific recombinase DNA invertase Pin n=1 Tax=Streptosporangium pseudovulgare TaxID=35765 RepID=A0ABQ2R2X9_9ACTN|nr:recombinase family protein [Streptosporangium pseudovulgare]GGQ11175.1 site-specific recombinase DNA invertase Pin [Streptosporangium pseudovulgare]